MAPQNPVYSRGFGVCPSRTRTRDCGFTARMAPQPVFFSVAKLGGSDSHNLRRPAQRRSDVEHRAHDRDHGDLNQADRPALTSKTQSPVRIHQGSTAKTPRNRGNFSGCSWMRAQSLCNSRLGGGARSLSRTRLWAEIPDLQGKYREIAQDPASREASVCDPAPSRGLGRRVP